MEGMATLEALHIIEARLACIVRHMQCQAPIQANNQEIQVVTDAKTCTYSLLTEEVAELKATWLINCVHIGIAEAGTWLCPHITGIEEDGTIQVAKQLSAVLKVTDKLDRTIA